MTPRKIISAVVLIALLAWLVYYAYNYRDDFAELTLVSPWIVIFLIVIYVLSYSLISVVNNTLLSALKVKMPLGESFLLSVVTGFYNLITPFRGGMAVRAVYLKKRYDFAYVHFLASLSAVYVLTFFVAGLLGMISTILIYLDTGIFSWILFWVFSVVTIGMLGIIFVSPKFKEFGKDYSHLPARKDRSPPPTYRGRAGAEEKGELSSWHKWLNRFIKVINGGHLIKHNRRVILVTSFVTLIQILLGSLMMWLQFRVFGLEVSFMAAVFLSAVGSLSLLIGLTPGNLGIQEAVVVFSASTIGISTAESLSAALLGRAVGLVVLFVLGPIFSWVLMKRTGGSQIAHSIASTTQSPPLPRRHIRPNDKLGEPVVSLSTKAISNSHSDLTSRSKTRPSATTTQSPNTRVESRLKGKNAREKKNVGGKKYKRV